MSIKVRTHKQIGEVAKFFGEPLSEVDKAFAIHTNFEQTKPQSPQQTQTQAPKFK